MRKKPENCRTFNDNLEDIKQVNNVLRWLYGTFCDDILRFCVSIVEDFVAGDENELDKDVEVETKFVGKYLRKKLMRIWDEFDWFGLG